MEENIYKNPYYIWNQNGIAVTNLHYDDKGLCSNVSINNLIFDVALNKNRWAIYQNNQDRNTEPLVYLTNDENPPSMQDVIRATEILSHALDNQRVSLIIPSSQTSKSNDGYLILSATKDEIAQWRTMYDITKLNLSSSIKFERQITGAKELKKTAIRVSDPQAIEKIKEFIDHDGIGIIPNSEIKNLGKANFIDLKLLSKPTEVGLKIYSQDLQTFYGDMPTPERVSRAIFEHTKKFEDRATVKNENILKQNVNEQNQTFENSMKM